MTRREALLASSPPMLVLLGVLVVESVVSVSTLAWNVVSICRRRHEFEADGE